MIPVLIGVGISLVVGVVWHLLMEREDRRVEQVGRGKIKTK